MELCLNLSRITRREPIIYMSSGEEILRAIASRNTRYAALWEPYAGEAVRKGIEIVADCRELGLQHCCTPGINRDIENRKKKTIIKAIEKALRETKKGKIIGIKWYTEKIGLPIDRVKKASKNYTYTDQLDIESVKKVLRKAGLRIPSPHILGKALVEEY